MRSKKSKQKNSEPLIKKAFWGAVSGMVLYATIQQYRKGLPKPAKEKVDEALDEVIPLSPYANTSVSPQQQTMINYGIAAALGAGYGILTAYFPILTKLRAGLIGSMTWAFRSTKLAGILGFVDTRPKPISQRLSGLATRKVFQSGLSQSFKRAER